MLEDKKINIKRLYQIFDEYKIEPFSFFLSYQLRSGDFSDEIDNLETPVSDDVLNKLKEFIKDLRLTPVLKEDIEEAREYFINEALVLGLKINNEGKVIIDLNNPDETELDINEITKQFVVFK